MNIEHESLKIINKNQLQKINISDIEIKLPELKNISESKSAVIAKWLIAWIENDLKSGKIHVTNLLPSKAEFAYKLGVSIGTMQNAFRIIEDLGYVESKQCIGTMVKDYKSQTTSVRKLTSKRELAVEAIKNYISSNNFRVGAKLPSSRTIGAIIGYCSNTTRIALETLSNAGIISHRYKNSNEYGWVVENTDFDVNNNQSAQTLVDIVVKDLENYINKNLKIGDKMPVHSQISKSLNASIKTVHDALKVLADKGIILPRRGRYGTTVIKMPNGTQTSDRPEMSIFAPAKDTAFYHYEKTQNRIKQMIASDYNIGDKLPSILELSSQMDLSPNTIRKAFANLSKEGYLVFSRGRYGGTFVIDIPEVETQSFKWLAVNPEFAKKYQNIN